METTNMVKRAQDRRRQGGFTLIELISVIIILGILAAVITPKYFDMTTRAQNSALDGATSEAAARLNMAYAAHIMATGGGAPANLEAMQGTNATSLGADVTAVNMGDYSAAYVLSGTRPNAIVTITLSNRDQAGVVTPITGSTHNVRIVPWPGN